MPSLNMITIYPNFLQEQDLRQIIEIIPLSDQQKVDYSPNVTTIVCPKLPSVNNTIKQFGNISFTEILTYNKNALSPTHVDNGPIDIWKVWKKTGILFCTDDYVGGNFYFSKLNIILKPAKNTLIIFPAGKDTDIYEHGVTEIISGSRITMIFRFI